jgi:hypothetical protein
MSERHQQENKAEHDREDRREELEEAVLAADDTGMVRNEVEIVTVETEQRP